MTMRVTTLALALVAWVLGSAGLAHAQVVYSVNTTYPFAPNPASTVTITLSQANWLPTPNGFVDLTVNSNGSVDTAATISLVCPNGSLTTGACSNPATLQQSNPIVAQALRTSAYPGVCTNSGSSTDLSADFSISGHRLTSLDCGGMAVVSVTLSSGNGPFLFIVPQDSNFNGMPDTWEVKYGGNLVASADNDGDGWSNMDEYRGVILANLPIRLHPLERDLFISFLNPGCGVSTLVGATNPNNPSYLPDTSNALSLFANLNNLLPATAGADPAGPRVHVLGWSAAAGNHGADSGEWVDNFTTCTFDPVAGDISFVGLSGVDRIVMVNGLYQVSESPLTTLTPSQTSGNGVTFTAGSKVFNQSHVGASLTSGNGVATIRNIGGVLGADQLTPATQVVADISSNKPFASTAAIAAGSWRISGADQKGLRCAESDDNSSTTIYAKSTWTTPDDTHQCSIFSKRIEFRMLNANTALGPQGLIPKGAGRKLKVVTTSNGGRTWDIVLFDQATCNCTSAEAQRRVIAEVMRFYVTMEYGHGGKLNPALGTCANHDCAGTGYLNDKDFTQVIDSKSALNGGYNTFRIPTVSSSTLSSGFKLRNP
jgi:hypothetical protein